MTRRRFLVASAVSGIGVCAFACNSSGPTPVCSTPSDGGDTSYCLLDLSLVRVVGAAALAVGEAVLANVDDATAVIVARDASGFHALSAICTHACCVVSLCRDTSCGMLTSTPDSCETTAVVSGDPIGAGILCPCHGSTFRLDDGVALTGPARTPLPSFALTIDGADILVDTGTRVSATTRTRS